MKGSISNFTRLLSLVSLVAIGFVSTLAWSQSSDAEANIHFLNTLRDAKFAPLESGADLPDAIQFVQGDAYYWPLMITEITVGQNVSSKRVRPHYRRLGVLRKLFGRWRYENITPRVFSKDFANSLLDDISAAQDYQEIYEKRLDDMSSDAVVCLDGPSYFAVTRKNGVVRMGMLQWCGFRETHLIACKINFGSSCVLESEE